MQGTKIEQFVDKLHELTTTPPASISDPLYAELARVMQANPASKQLAGELADAVRLEV